MNIYKINANGFQAKIQFNNKKISKNIQDRKPNENHKSKVVSDINKTLLTITCFSAIITKLIKVRNGIKLPS